MTVPASPCPPAGLQPRTVLLSRNETESLCMKAARGAGFAWGLAEEAGFAAGWLAAEGVDGTSPLLALLIRQQGQPANGGRPGPAPGHWRSADQGALCPITTGAALIDNALIADGPLSHELRLDPVAAPVLLLPFLARAAGRCHISLRIGWSGGDLLLTPDGELDRTAAAGLIGHDALAMTLRPDRRHESRCNEPANLPPVSTSVLDALGALALRTTVPATAASRRGAGSATADND